MTPDEARDLLDGTTPGPWYLSSSRSVDGIDIVMYDDTVLERRNIALAAAAPDMARMIAGMREEWGVKWDDDPNGLPDWGFPTRAAAEKWEKEKRHYGPKRGRIVRRVVGPWKEA